MDRTLEELAAIAETIPEEIEDTHSLERDMLQATWFRDKVRASKSYAQNLYAALCNNEFQKQEVWPILQDRTWSCTWRYAGGIVANLEGQGGDYIDWYCSGMVNGHPDDDTDPDFYDGFVPEGTITSEIREDLEKLDWIPVGHWSPVVDQ